MHFLYDRQAPFLRSGQDLVGHHRFQQRDMLRCQTLFLPMQLLRLCIVYPEQLLDIPRVLK